MIKYTTKYCKKCGPLETTTTETECYKCGLAFNKVDPIRASHTVNNLQALIKQRQEQIQPYLSPKIIVNVESIYIDTKENSGKRKNLSWILVPLAIASFIYGLWYLGIILLFLSRKSI